MLFTGNAKLIRGHGVLTFAAALETSGRLAYYKVWSNESMEMAIQSVQQQQQEFSVQRAAEVYSIHSLPCMIESQVEWFMVYAVDQSHT